MIVVGGGVIGLEYAIMFATLGVQVTVVDGRAHAGILRREIIEALRITPARGTFRLGETCHRSRTGRSRRRCWKAASGSPATPCCSRPAAGATDDLDLDAAGLNADNRGRVW